MTCTPSADGSAIRGRGRRPSARSSCGEEGVDRALRRHVLADRDHAEIARRVPSSSFSSVGSSLTHGAHQLAHRLTSTGLPRNVARLMSLAVGIVESDRRRRFALVAAVDALACPRRPRPAPRACCASGFCLSQPAVASSARSRTISRTGNSNPMWGGRFAGGPAAVMREINASIAIDKRLWREDIAASRAHAAMLRQPGILSSRGCRRDRPGPRRSRRGIEAGKLARTPRSKTSTCMSSIAWAS